MAFALMPTQAGLAGPGALPRPAWAPWILLVALGAGKQAREKLLAVLAYLSAVPEQVLGGRRRGDVSRVAGSR